MKRIRNKTSKDLPAIRYVTLSEMHDLTEKKQKCFKGKCVCVSFDNVFLHHPGQGLLNRRAFKVCRKCGKYYGMEIEGKIQEEISRIISEKIRKANQ